MRGAAIALRRRDDAGDRGRVLLVATGAPERSADRLFDLRRRHPNDFPTHALAPSATLRVSIRSAAPSPRASPAGAAQAGAAFDQPGTRRYHPASRAAHARLANGEANREDQVVGIIPARMTARIEGDFVVFLIGMRINKPWKLARWLPVAKAMPRMLAEVQRGAPANGFLGVTRLGLFALVQYWRSFEALEAYARDRDGLHQPAWAAFDRAARDARGDVGIWHETYLVRDGQYESIYSGMPPTGLGAAGTLAPATGPREDARGRLAAN
jgi:hypothetical protein